MIRYCARCGKEDVPALPIFKPQDMTWFTPDHSLGAPKLDSACAECITDSELARALYPVAEFVLSHIPRDRPDLAAALETSQAILATRNNGTTIRDAALRAIGLSV